MTNEDPPTRIITTVEELEELRPGAVVRDGDLASPTVYECQETGDFLAVGSNHPSASTDIQLPATVLDEGPVSLSVEGSGVSEIGAEGLDPEDG